MKYLLIAAISILTLSCKVNGQSKDMIVEIELSKESRGFQEFVRINADSLNVLMEDRKGAGSSKNFGRKITADEWENLIRLTQEFNVSEISAFPSPTLKRASDGAMHSNITIRTKNGESFSHGYDDENPHDALKPLHKAIRDLSQEQH